MSPLPLILSSTIKLPVDISLPTTCVSPLLLILPFTVNLLDGPFVPIPTLSVPAFVNNKLVSVSPYILTSKSAPASLKVISS